jgi:phosphosulfolactate synthase
VSLLELPHRETKPRRSGLTMVIDNGMPQRAFADAITSGWPHIDLVKFGWGTALVTPGIEAKMELLRRMDIDYFLGGTLFEKFVSQDRFGAFLGLCRRYQCRYVEISNGTVPIPPAAKASCINRAAGEFTVLAEVGFKDPVLASELTPAGLVEAVRSDLEAGAELVVTEARESGRSGICRSDGTPRQDLIDAVVASGVDLDRLVFEAPTKDLQVYFIKLAGPNVNLGNIAPCDAIGVETLRLGLRSETLTSFEPSPTRA